MQQKFLQSATPIRPLFGIIDRAGSGKAGVSEYPAGHLTLLGSWVTLRWVEGKRGHRVRRKEEGEREIKREWQILLSNWISAGRDSVVERDGVYYPYQHTLLNWSKRL